MPTSRVPTPTSVTSVTRSGAVDRDGRSRKERAEDLQVMVKRLEDKIDRFAAELPRGRTAIGHNWIFFLKKLPITIKIRFMASPMITVTRPASVTSRRSWSWT